MAKEKWNQPVQRIFFFYCLSGFISLGYQVVWFRIFADRFGSTALTFLLVLGSFIGGLGLGAICSRAATQRLALNGRRLEPLRVYGLVELLVTSTALLTLAVAFIPADLWGDFPYQLHDGLYSRTLADALVQLAIGVLCVAVPSFFMGLSFPLLAHAYRAHQRFPSALYAWNTLGACVGVLVTQFLLIPRLGHDVTYAVMLALNLLLALYFLLTKSVATDVTAPRCAVQRTGSERQGRNTRAIDFGTLLALATLSGFMVGALEGDLLKRIWLLGATSSAAMAFVSFWAILAIFLASWTVQAVPSLRLVHIKLSYTLALLYYALLGAFAYPIRDRFEATLAAAPFDTASTMPVVQTDPGVSLLFVGVFVFPVIYLAALLLPYVCNAAQDGGRGDGEAGEQDGQQDGQRRLGRIYGINTLAFCVGLIAFVWLAPRVNIFYSMKLMMVLMTIAVLVLWMIAEHRRVGRWSLAACIGAVAAAIMLTPEDFDRTLTDPARRPFHMPVHTMKSNGTHTTFVVSAPDGDFLYFDFHPMSGNGILGQTYMRLMAHVPLLAQHTPRRALLIGFGVGNTAAAIVAHKEIEGLDVVELNHRVIETAPQFVATNDNVHRDPRVRFIHDDGRRFLALTSQRYDLITAEPPPPTQDGVYRLYSREYYRQVLTHLTPQGRFSQWLPIAQLSAQAVDRIVATFLEVFPHAVLFTGYGRELILIGGSQQLDLPLIARRMRSAPSVAADLARLGVATPLALFARILKGDAGLRRDYAGHVVISDQRNDLAEPFKRSERALRIIYDPHEMLADTGAQRLDFYDELRGVVTHLGRLQYRVPGMPLAALQIVVGPREVALGDVNWQRIEALQMRYGYARRTGQHDIAMARLRDSLEHAVVQPRAWLEMASLHLAQGRDVDALEALQRFLSIEPREVIGLVYTASALTRLKRYVQALDAARQAVAVAPSDARTYSVRGDVFAAMGQNLQALNDYRMALRLNPKHTAALASEALVIEKLRKAVMK
ncbi:MAG: spermidine synthase [Gammaproteobacteria bacterium]